MDVQEELAALEEEFKKEKQKLMSIRHKIDDLKNNELLPDVKKRYEGKYFKCKNSYSLPEAEGDYWYVYYKVVNVNDVKMFEGVSFQTDTYGKVTVDANCDIFDTLLQTPITEKEFMEAYQKVLDNLLVIAQVNQ